jgi:hypothetical protein
MRFNLQDLLANKAITTTALALLHARASITPAFKAK